MGVTAILVIVMMSGMTVVMLMIRVPVNMRVIVVMDMKMLT